MAEIIPSILTADFNDFTQKIRQLSGITDRVQVDFVDGKFAPNQTVSLEAIKTIEEMEKVKVDLHLMVKEPVDWIARSLEILPDRVIAQVEMMADPLEFVTRLAETGVEVGLGIDLDTPLSAVSEEIYHSIDLVLLMAVKAGAGGQLFDRKALEKIKQVSEIVGESAEIAVDGGLNDETIKLAHKAGAGIFYVGSSFWQAEDLGTRYNELMGLIKND